MGQTFKWYCEKCNYSALVSGGTDRGFYSFKNTYICSNCEIIMDLSLEVSENGEPIERVIFYPFAFFINKHIEFILQEVNNKSLNPKIEYYEDSGKYFVVSKRIITRTFFKDLFKDLTSNIFMDEDDIEELKSEKKSEKKREKKKNRCWYNFLGFKKVVFPTTCTFHFIPRCRQCNSEDVEIWSDHVCPKCSSEMKKGRLEKLWD